MKEYITLIKNPREFFKSVAKEDTNAILKRVMPVVLTMFIIQSALGYLISRKLNAFLNIPSRGPAFYFLTVAIALPLGIIISAALLHLSLKILKSKSIFSQNLKILIYALIPLSIISIISYLIILIIPVLYVQILLFFIFIIALFIAGVIYEVIGISEQYKISTGRAVGAYFLHVGLIFGAMIALLIIIIILILIVALVLKGLK